MLSFITIGNSPTTVITKAEIVVIVVNKKKNTKLIDSFTEDAKNAVGTGFFY